MPPNQASQVKQVAVLIESTYVFGRRVVQGVVRYQRQNGPWSILFRPLARGESPPSWLKQWKGDGIIVRCFDNRMARALLATGLPVVDLPFTREGNHLPRILIDNRPIVEMAFAHLWERGFRNFAYCGTPRGQNSTIDERGDLFAALVRNAGCEINLFRASRHLQSAGTWGFDKEPLARWLLELPKPVAILACHDPRGQQVLEACQHARVHVPEEVAVLGVDNDELVCEICNPPLSSVEVDQHTAGFRAAGLLDQMMSGRKPPARQQVVDVPLRIVLRQSTDLLAVEDREVADALQIIRQRSGGRLRVSDLLRVVPISRSMLERRMKLAIGRTPKAEILRVQLEHVKEMLSTTDLSLAEISEHLGHMHPQHLATLFKSKSGLTPGEYRRRYRR